MRKARQTVTINGIEILTANGIYEQSRNQLQCLQPASGMSQAEFEAALVKYAVGMHKIFADAARRGSKCPTCGHVKMIWGGD
jgi:hypothetical protein